MALTSPPLVKVNPGDPIASQQWNNIIDAIGALFDAFNKVTGSLDVTVKDRASGNPVQGAVVNIIPSGTTQGPPRAAYFVGDGINRYRFDQLPPGTYDIIVQAPGFLDETAPVTMAADGSSQSLNVQLTAAQALVSVPALFGRALNEAVTLLGTDLQIGRVIDSHGNDIAPGGLTDAAKTAFVLNQSPPPGALVPKNTALFVCISAKAEFTARVKVPDIRGLTIDQARAALEGSQLTLGPTKNA
jgi:hypothetical protein